LKYKKNKLPTVLFAEGGGGRPGDTMLWGLQALIVLLLLISHSYPGWYQL